jgi:hypothetical protein
MLCIVPSFTTNMPAVHIASSAPSSVVVSTVGVSACASVASHGSLGGVLHTTGVARPMTTHTVTRTTRSSATSLATSHILKS